MRRKINSQLKPHFFRQTVSETMKNAQPIILPPHLAYQLDWWKSHFVSRHPRINQGLEKIHAIACDTFRFIHQQNEYSIDMRMTDETINATGFQKSLFPGVTVGKKGCSDGREKKSVFVGKTFKGVKGPGGVARVTDDGDGSRLASEILCAGITESTQARDEILELFVGHESKIKPVIKGCAAQNAAFKLHYGRTPIAYEARNFTRSMMARTLGIFDKHVNDERSYYKLPPLAVTSTIAYRNTDDLSISLCHPDVEKEFDIADFALRSHRELRSLFDRLDQRNRKIFSSHKVFQTVMVDPAGIPAYESAIAAAMDVLMHDQKLLFMAELKQYVTRSHLSPMSSRQFAGLAAFMARNLAIVHGAGYVYENEKHKNDPDYYPSHFFADHREITLVVSRKGKHPGISCPHLQFLLSSPETQADAIADVALLAAGVLKKYSPDRAHPLIIADTDAGTLRSYTASIINAPQTEGLLREGYIFPVPVLIDEDRRIKSIGVTL